MDDIGDDTARVTENARAAVDKAERVITGMSDTVRQAIAGLGTSAGVAATQAAAARELQEVRLMADPYAAWPPGFDSFLSTDFGEPDENGDHRITVAYPCPAGSTYTVRLGISPGTLILAKTDPEAAAFLDRRARTLLTAPPQATLAWSPTPPLPVAVDACPDRSRAIAYARARMAGDRAEMNRIMGEIVGEQFAIPLAEALRAAAETLRVAAESASKIVDILQIATPTTPDNAPSAGGEQ